MADRGEGGGGTPAWRSPGLVDRDALLDELSTAADAALCGAGSVVLLTGEAGIGKTSLTREVARRFRDTMTVTWGNCPSDGTAPALWPWQSLIDVDLAQAGRGDIPETAIGAERFERVNELCRVALNQALPRLHVVEDLQWADVASVLLLVAVATSIGDTPLMVMATLRTGEPLAAGLVDATDALLRTAVVHAVPPLSSGAVETMIRAAGLDPESDAASAVLNQAGGNPLFVTEMLRAARGVDAHDRRREPLDTEVPARISELVASRLARLPDALSDLVVTASVLGTEGDTRTLATVHGVAVEAVVDLLEQARAARLLDAAPPGRWQFCHALVRDAVYASATDARRARTHATAVDVLADSPAAPPTLLAHHALAAQPLLDAQRAVALATAAGTAALFQHSYEDAVRWFDRALAVATPTITADQHAQLLVLSGEAHRQSGDLEPARRAFRRASELTDSAELLARVALGHADPGADLGIAYRTEAVTEELLERAIAAQPDDQATTTLLLRARLAAELYFSDQPGRARRLADDALRQAQRLGDPRSLVAAGAVHHDAFVVGQTPLATQLEGSEQLLHQARQSRSASALLTAHRARAFDLLAAGDLSTMDAEILAFRRVAEPLAVEGYLWWPALWAAMRELLEGHHDSAEELALAAYATGERSFPTLAFTNLSFLLFFLRREQGRFAEMEGPTREYSISHADIPAIRVALAFLLAEIGRHDEARGMLDAIRERDLPAMRDRNWPAAWFQLARAASLVGDRDLAAQLLDDAHHPTERCVTVSLATVCLGATDLASAWLLGCTGDLDAASARYRSAELTNARIGARSWLAQTRADHAALLVERDQAGDRAEALRLAELAGETAESIGLVSVAADIALLRSRLGGSAPDAPTSAPVATFRRAGPTWQIEFRGRAAQLPHARGLTDLAALLARPGTAVPAIELLGAGAAHVDAVRGAPALDERARREIRQRLTDLDSEIAESEADNDFERAAGAREQRQLLAEAVARDLGLGGRSRRVDDPVERARKTVSTRIRRAISAVDRVHPELGRHLSRSVDTGAWCAYRPAEPTTWIT